MGRSKCRGRQSGKGYFRYLQIILIMVLLTACGGKSNTPTNQLYGSYTGNSSGLLTNRQMTLKFDGSKVEMSGDAIYLANGDLFFVYSDISYSISDGLIEFATPYNNRVYVFSFQQTQNTLIIGGTVFKKNY